MNYENYDDIADQLRALGLVLKGNLIEVDTAKSVRCTVDGEGREKRGWYWLHSKLTEAGQQILIGSAGVYRGNDPGTVKLKVRVDGKRAALSDAELAAMKARLASDLARKKAEDKAVAERAARRASLVWRKALVDEPPGGVADYLVRKGVQNHGLRFTESGALVVPMLDVDSRVHGLQFILPSHHRRKRKTGRDKEYWPQGLVKQGHFYLIGSPAGSAVCLVCEGVATGFSLHEATGLPVAIAFDAGNLMPVVQALAKRYRTTRWLVCADDDYRQQCKACNTSRVRVDLGPNCPVCGAQHGRTNPGATAADNAATAVSGAWVAPAIDHDRDGNTYLTDFNDLHLAPTGGLASVRQQIERKLDALGWTAAAPARTGHTRGEGGDTLKALYDLDEAADRWTLIYGGKGSMFDGVDRIIVHKDDVMALLPDHASREWKRHPSRKVVRLEEVGFDPTDTDPRIKCNLWAGWPTPPRAGECSTLLQMLRYLCSQEDPSGGVYEWVLKWLAYPIQHPGAKMHSAILVHGPQGTGKSRFFEAYGQIFGPYGLVLDQAAVEDKFNADWASKRLYILADEIVAQQEMFHVKNRLKGLITGKTIRINTKTVTAYTEANHMNLVFLSNEKRPLILEDDDRRHCVIWTPPEPEREFFDAVDAEIAAGGIPALHQYLLDLDLGDFRPWTKPPMTESKRDLIELGMGSEERFINEWRNGHVDRPFCPCGSADLYAVYKSWAVANGVARIRESNAFMGCVRKIHGWEYNHKDIFASADYGGATRRQRMVIPSDADLARAALLPGSIDYRKPDGERQNRWLTQCFFAFREAGENRA